MTHASQLLKDGERLTTEQQIEELRAMLNDSVCHERRIVRPHAVIDERPEIVEGGRAVYGPGPITIVSFFITHCPAMANENNLLNMKSSRGEAVNQIGLHEYEVLTAAGPVRAKRPMGGA